MSNNQDITTNAQTTDGQDVEGHRPPLGWRSDQGTMADALSPQGARVTGNDTPDGEDDVEGHAPPIGWRSDGGDESQAGLDPKASRPPLGW